MFSILLIKRKLTFWGIYGPRGFVYAGHQSMDLKRLFMEVSDFMTRCMWVQDTWPG